MKFTDMKVLLTGATGGIGRETAKRLADAGAGLLLAARNESRLVELRDRLRKDGATVDVVAADLSTQDGLAATATAARHFGGGINVLVNNAGLNRFGRFSDREPGELRTLVEINLVAPLLLTHRLLPLLAAQPRSAVLNVGSIAGSIGLPGQVAYSSSKFGLHGATEALRRELAGSSIRILYVAPRGTDTEMNDELAREVNERTGVAMDDPAHVARRIIEVLAGTKAERFIGWPERLAVKLNALAPRMVDRSLRKQADLLTPADLQTTRITTPEGVK